jgi:CheY-like chemotaxis protein
MIANNLLRVHEVVVSSDGNEGPRLAEQQRFDLMILDVMLPGRSGFELCRTVRERGFDGGILMLTARAQVASGGNPARAHPASGPKAFSRAQSTRKNTTFDSSDFRNIVPRFTPEARKRTRGSSICCGRSPRTKVDTCPDGARLAACAEALDSPDSQNDQAESIGGEHCCTVGRTDV